MDMRVIAKVQDYGFDVYMRNGGDTWLLFTDGTRIGYLQHERGLGFSLGTVHKPNKTTGTGFQVRREVADFDKAALEECFAFMPHWAADRDRQSVVKYRDIAEYIAADSFNQEYQRVSVVANPD